MTFDLPDRVNASFDAQARLFSNDVATLAQPWSLTGVKSGCAVTAQGSPNMTLAVAAGVLYFLGAEVVVSAGNVTITTANATQPRIDIVVVNSSGVKSVVAGTAAVAPLEPATPASSVMLAQVYVPALDTAIGATQIRDRRIIVQLPAIAGAPNVVRKTADEAVTSSTAQQNDDELFFAVNANTIYAVKFVLEATSASVQTLRYQFTAPASTVYRFATNVGATIGSDSSSQGTFAQASSGFSAVALLEGTVATAGTAGTFRLQWAQNASGAALTMLKNSYLEYRVMT